MVEKRVPDPLDWKLSADSPHSLSPSIPASIQAPWDCQLLQAGTTHSVIAPGPNPENSTHRCLIPIESSWTGLAGKQLLAEANTGQLLALTFPPSSWTNGHPSLSARNWFQNPQIVPSLIENGLVFAYNPSALSLLL